MNTLTTHIIYTLIPYLKNKNTWIKFIFIIPINTIIPYLLMTMEYVSIKDVEVLFYTNLLWSYIYFSAIESFLSKENIISSNMINQLLMTPRNIYFWIIGQTFGINLFFLLSILITSLMINMLVGVNIVVFKIILVCFVGLVTSFSINMVIFSFQLRFQRIFHFINFLFDILKFLACVLYPLLSLPIILQKLSILFPVTWINEFYRVNNVSFLIIWLLENSVLLLLAKIFIDSSLKRFKLRGGLYD